MTIRVTHRMKAVGKCPVNGEADHYDVEITLQSSNPDNCPMVESIGPLVQEMLEHRQTQEQFTYTLAQALRATVTTRGRHGQFDTECTCEGEQ